MKMLWVKLQVLVIMTLMLCSAFVSTHNASADEQAQMPEAKNICPARAPLKEVCILSEDAESDEAMRVRNFDEREIYSLTKIAMAEAEGESTEGKALVIMVVLNRVSSEEFADTIEDVIHERTSDGGWQFTSMYDGGRWYTTEPTEDCYKAVEMVMNGWDESKGALYFERTSAEETWHRRNLEYLFSEGNHTFYK